MAIYGVLCCGETLLNCMWCLSLFISRDKEDPGDDARGGVGPSGSRRKDQDIRETRG